MRLRQHASSDKSGRTRRGLPACARVASACRRLRLVLVLGMAAEVVLYAVFRKTVNAVQFYYVFTRGPRGVFRCEMLCVLTADFTREEIVPGGPFVARADVSTARRYY